MIRLCTARAASDALRAGATAEEAAAAIVEQAKRRLSGEGGVIIARRDGSLGWARSTQTMTWAAASERWSSTKAGA